jgi:hypothetical protein
MLAQTQPPQLKIVPLKLPLPAAICLCNGRTQEEYRLYIVRSTTVWLEQTEMSLLQQVQDASMDTPTQSDSSQRLCWQINLLMISTMCSKHVE